MIEIADLIPEKDLRVLSPISTIHHPKELPAIAQNREMFEFVPLLPTSKHLSTPLKHVTRANQAPSSIVEFIVNEKKKFTVKEVFDVIVWFCDFPLHKSFAKCFTTILTSLLNFLLAMTDVSSSECKLTNSMTVSSLHSLQSCFKLLTLRFEKDLNLYYHRLLLHKKKINPGTHLHRTITLLQEREMEDGNLFNKYEPERAFHRVNHWIQTRKEILTNEEFEKPTTKMSELAPVEAYYKLATLGFCKLLSYLVSTNVIKLALSSSPSKSLCFYRPSQSVKIRKSNLRLSFRTSVRTYPPG